MPLFEVNIGSKGAVTVEANSEEEARRKIELDIAATAARQSAVPYLDEILFDNEKGVQDNKIRRLLARADNPLEREGIALKTFGKDGFTYNSKGELAVTPAGLARIGEEADFITLNDGSKIGVNRIVDEKDWFSRGDFADFAGSAGPIIGALTALTPQAKVLGALSKVMKFFGGGPRLTRITASGLGSAAGKGVEEAIEAKDGLQMQTDEQIRDMVRGEFYIGAAAQGLGEALGVGYGLLLGKQAPFDNLRLYRQATQGRNLDDIMKLDKSLGREATEKEIKKAIKDGKITIYKEKGLPSQTAFGRSLPGRAQSLSEQVLGNQRVEQSKAYLFRGLTDLFGKLNKETVEGDDLIELIKRYQGRTAMTPAQKRELDNSVKAQVGKMKDAEINSIQQLETLLDDVMDDFTKMGIYKSPITRQKVGEEIRATVAKAKDGVTQKMANYYRIIDSEFETLKDPAVNAVISRGVVKPRLDNAEKVIDDFVNSNYAATVNIGDAATMNSDPTSYLRNVIIKRMKDDVDNLEKGFSLTGLRNTISTLQDERRLVIHDTYLGKMVDDVLAEFKGIFDDLAEGAIVGNKFILPKKAGTISFTELERQKVGRAVAQLKKANEYSRKVLEPFDNAILQKIKQEGKYGAYDVLEIYDRAVQNGSATSLRDIFKAVRNYDDYIDEVAPAGLRADNELKLRNSLKQKLLSDAFSDSLDAATDTIDFAKFATYLRNFDKKSPGKLRFLFADEPGFDSEKFLRVINQINTVKPNIKPADITKLMKQFNKSDGIAEKAAGRKFIEGLDDLAKAKSEAATFEGNLIIRKLPEATTEEVVSKIFTPQGSSNIRLVRETVGEDAFREIQNNAMNKILQRAIDFDGLTKKGDIAKIFQADKFNNILRSYGDETLEAMFGKDVAVGLKNYGKTLEIMTKGEVGRGGAAGTLIAAGIAINAFNPALWPTVAGLAVMRAAFQNPFFLKLMARTDKSAATQLIELFERMFRIYGVGEASDVMFGAVDELQEGLEESLQTIDQDTDAQNQLLEVYKDAQRAASASPITDIDLPDIAPVSNIQRPLSEDPSVRAAILTGGQSIV